MAKEKKKNKSKQQKQKKQTGVKTFEITALCLVALSIFIGISLYCPKDTGGAVGNFINSLFKGLLGLTAYILPPAIAGNIIYTLVKGSDTKQTTKYILSGAFILNLSAIFHMIFLATNNGVTWSMYYTYSQSNGAGGLLGACIAKPLCNLLGIAGTNVLLYVILAILFICLFEISILRILNAIVNGIKSIFAKAGQEMNAIREENLEKSKKQNKDKPYKLKTRDESQKQDEYQYAEIENYKETEPEIPAFDDDLTINVPGNDLDNEQPTEEAIPEQKLTDNEKEELHSEFEKEMELHIEEKEPFEYVYPSTDLLTMPKANAPSENVEEELKQNALKLVETFKSFGVDTTVVEISQGPTITRYEVKPASGVRVNQITTLANDIQLSLAAKGVIIAPVPGKSTVGIEIANKNPSIVSLREVIESDEFKNHPSKLAVALGKDISGKPIIMDLAKMPHLLIAGATGAGKSVCINTLVISMLYKADPSEVKLVMIDPKQVELGVYNGIPHLLIPVVKDAKKATGALSWAVQEMTERYSKFEQLNVRNIQGYNDLMVKNGTPEQKMPSIVILIDEFADLMMVAPGDVENYVCRIAQLARAAGMHLVIATQRPVVKFITGNIKANVPSRIAFMVASNKDSQTILDMGGAEKLIGKGDMLYLPVGETKPKRMQCAFVSDSDVKDIVEAVSNGIETVYNADIMEQLEAEEKYQPDGEDAGDADELLPEAIEMAIDNGQISTSLLQRRFRIGYNRAGSIIDQMEQRGIIGGLDGNKPRQVLITREQYNELVASSKL